MNSSNSNNNVEDMKHKDVSNAPRSKLILMCPPSARWILKAKPWKLTKLAIGTILALTDTDPDTRKSATALIMKQKDEKHQREIITLSIC